MRILVGSFLLKVLQVGAWVCLVNVKKKPVPQQKLHKYLHRRSAR